MKKKIHYNYILNYLLFFITIMTSAQNSDYKKIIDSLSEMSYKEMDEILIKEEVDTTTTKFHMEAYLLKAKRDNDSLKLCRALYIKNIHSKDKKANLRRLDSIIAFSKNIKNKKYITIAYHDKGIHFYGKRKFKVALDYYLLAKKNNKGSKRSYIEYLINDGIASLKNRIGYDDEALIIYRKGLIFAKKESFETSNKREYFSLLFSLAHTFRKKNSLDSALYYNSKALKITSTLKKFEDYYYFLILNDGVINYHNKNYAQSYDSIVKGLNYTKKIDDKPNIAVGNYYLGKLNMEFGKVDEAMENFKKVDTIFQLNNDILPECRESYIYLSNYYRDKKDFTNQLVYTERLLEVDSVLTDNYTFLSKKINHEYDRQNLLSEKQSLIKKINGEKNNYFNIIIGVIAIASILVFVLVYFIKKNKEKKTRLETLLKKLDTKKEDNNLKKENKKSAINDAILKDIELKLQCFELNKQFTDSNLSVNSLASDFKTNSNYLSKTVNQLKGKNFSNYINELRIEHAINRLKNEPNFKKYTIQAIAEDVGFNTAQSFSNAFYKSTGIKPSYFIKNI